MGAPARPSVVTDVTRETEAFKADVHALIEAVGAVLPDNTNPIIAISALASLMAQYAVVSGVPRETILQIVDHLLDVAERGRVCVMIDVVAARIVTGIGRNILERRIAELCDEVERLRARPAPTSEEARSFAEMFETLGRCQARCGELLEENRVLKRARGIANQ